MDETKSRPMDVPNHDRREEQIAAVKAASAQLHAAGEIMDLAEKEMQRQTQAVSQEKESSQPQEIEDKSKRNKYDVPLDDRDWEQLLQAIQNASPFVKEFITMIHDHPEKMVRQGDIDAFLKERAYGIKVHNFLQRIEGYLKKLPFRLNFNIADRKFLMGDEKRFVIYKRRDL